MNSKRGLKLLTLILSIMIVGSTLTACDSGNRKSFHEQGTVNYAYVQLQNGEVVEGCVKSWAENIAKTIEIEFMDGKVYIVAPCNCTLIYDPKLQDG